MGKPTATPWAAVALRLSPERAARIRFALSGLGIFSHPDPRRCLGLSPQILTGSRNFTCLPVLRLFARSHFRNFLRLVPPSGCPEFALQRALPEDKVNLELRAIARPGRGNNPGSVLVAGRNEETRGRVPNLTLRKPDSAASDSPFFESKSGGA